MGRLGKVADTDSVAIRISVVGQNGDNGYRCIFICGYGIINSCRGVIYRLDRQGYGGCIAVKLTVICFEGKGIAAVVIL